jgi:hypothetical protein
VGGRPPPVGCGACSSFDNLRCGETALPHNRSAGSACLGDPLNALTWLARTGGSTVPIVAAVSAVTEVHYAEIVDS